MFQTKSSRIHCLISTIFIALSLLFIFVGKSNGQYASVKKLTAETSDGIRLSAWITKSTVSLNESLTIGYEIENSSKNIIYLVRKNGEINTSINADVLNVPFLIPFSGDSGEYHYNFTKIQRGKTYRGQIIIPAGRLNKEQAWLVELGFGFVTNIDGLNRQLRVGDDPVPYREMLSERVKIIGINGLVVEVEEA